jgi:hypothetical protein
MVDVETKAFPEVAHVSLFYGPANSSPEKYSLSE